MAKTPKKSDSSVTIADIARKTGLSTATISRALNNAAHRVNSETQRKVLLAAEELNYISNPYAKGLKGCPNVIGLCLGFSLQDDPGCAYTFAACVAGINEVALEHDFHVFLDTVSDSTRFDENIGLFRNVPTAGILVFSPHNNSPFIPYLIKRRTPFVILGSHAFQYSHYVDIDHYNLGRRAVRYLADLGRRKIACLGGPANFSASQDMVLGYSSMVSELNLRSSSQWIEYANWTIENGREIAGRMLRLPEPPDAIFAGNDFLAIGAMQAASSLGIGVPEKVSIIGVDDYLTASITSPALTTFRNLDYEIAQKATKVLISEILQGKKNTALHQELLLPDLIIRESCGSGILKQMNKAV